MEEVTPLCVVSSITQDANGSRRPPSISVIPIVKGANEE